MNLQEQRALAQALREWREVLYARQPALLDAFRNFVLEQQHDMIVMADFYETHYEFVQRTYQ